LQKRPFREKAGGRYAVGFFFRLPARHVSGSAESVKVLISGSPARRSSLVTFVGHLNLTSPFLTSFFFRRD
jgi:hypothetical protein